MDEGRRAFFRSQQMYGPNDAGKPTRFADHRPAPYTRCMSYMRVPHRSIFLPASVSGHHQDPKQIDFTHVQAMYIFAGMEDLVLQLTKVD
jgi:hypothetical protein